MKRFILALCLVLVFVSPGLAQLYGHIPAWQVLWTNNVPGITNMSQAMSWITNAMSEFTTAGITNVTVAENPSNSVPVVVLTNNEAQVDLPAYLDTVDLSGYVRWEDLWPYLSNTTFGSSVNTFGYIDDGTYHYGQNDVGLTYQYYQVTTATNKHRTLLSVFCWGGGGEDDDSPGHSWAGYQRGGAGGFTYGQFWLVDPAVFNAANKAHVTNGMYLAVQVGGPSGRAAVWRTGYDFVTNECLAAGAGGGGYRIISHGGLGGGSAGTDGEIWKGVTDTYGPTIGGGKGQAGSGGAAGSKGTAGSNGHVGYAGVRVWGGYYANDTIQTTGRGGDGYYGGGSSAIFYHSSWESGWTGGGGGGGSGFAHPTMSNAYTAAAYWDMTAVQSYPSNRTSSAYGESAGMPGYNARVVFIQQ